MKKLFIFFIVFYFKSTFSFAEENKCNEFKKLSKEYIECNAKKLKEVSSKKAKELKVNLVEIGDKVKNKIKKKE